MDTEWDKFPKPDWIKAIPINDNRDCLHKNCGMCGGTGIKKDGTGVCLHMLSCPCPDCSPWC